MATFFSAASPVAASFSSSLNFSPNYNQLGFAKTTNLKMAPAGSRARNGYLSLRTAGGFRVSCVAKPETVQKVCEIVRKQLALSEDIELTPESKFSALGADSLDTVEIVMGLEEEFGINVEEESSDNITTVQEAADLIEKLIQKGSG